MGNWGKGPVRTNYRRNCSSNWRQCRHTTSYNFDSLQCRSAAWNSYRVRVLGPSFVTLKGVGERVTAVTKASSGITVKTSRNQFRDIK